MKAKNINGIDRPELERQVQDAQEQLFRLRFQMGMGQMEGLKKYRTLKKDRARMLTALNQGLPPAETSAPAVKKPAARKTVAAAGATEKKSKKR